MLTRVITGFLATQLAFSASAENLGIIVAKPQVNLPNVDALSAMGAELGVERINIATGTIFQEYLEKFEIFQNEDMDGVLTLGADYLDPNLFAALSPASGFTPSVRLPLLDLPANLISDDQTDLYIVLPSGRAIRRALTSAWFTPMGDEMANVVNEGGAWLVSSEFAAQELRNMGLFFIGDTSSGYLFNLSGNTFDDDGCGCEDSGIGTCDPDGANRNWREFDRYLQEREDECGGGCENGRFTSYSEFQTSSLYRDLESNGWASMTELNELSSSGASIYVFSCDPD